VIAAQRLQPSCGDCLLQGGTIGYCAGRRIQPVVDRKTLEAVLSQVQLVYGAVGGEGKVRIAEKAQNIKAACSRQHAQMDAGVGQSGQFGNLGYGDAFCFNR
jgi:hypothetical protein